MHKKIKIILKDAEHINSMVPPSLEDKANHLVKSSGLSAYQNLQESSVIAQAREHIDELERLKYQPKPITYTEIYHPPLIPKPKQLIIEKVFIGECHGISNDVKPQKKSIFKIVNDWATKNVIGIALFSIIASLIATSIWDNYHSHNDKPAMESSPAKVDKIIDNRHTPPPPVKHKTK